MGELLIEFVTNRLKLRAYRVEDWEQVHIYGANPDFSKYELWGPNTVEDTHKFVGEMVSQASSNPRFKYDFAVCLKETHLLIGGCGIRRESEESLVANLGWAINPEFQGKGYATEAARSLIQFGFGQLGLSVIYATCDTRNVASYRVMEKLPTNPLRGLQPVSPYSQMKTQIKYGGFGRPVLPFWFVASGRGRQRGTPQPEAASGFTDLAGY